MIVGVVSGMACGPSLAIRKGRLYGAAYRWCKSRRPNPLTPTVTGDE